MKLSIERIKEITLGAERVYCEEGETVFRRFSEAEEAAYAEKNDGEQYYSELYNRTFTTAGIKLSFRTNSKSIYIKFRAVDVMSSRSFFSLDIRSDGALVGSLDNFSGVSLPEKYYDVKLTIGEKEGCFELPEGDKTVTLYLPWSVDCRLKELSLDDGAYIHAAAKPDKVLISYGDSITHGYDACYPVNRYMTKLSERLSAVEYCKAIGGEVFYPRLAELAEIEKPDYITVAYGTNDWGLASTKDEFKESCAAFYRAISEKYPNASIFAITPIWRADFREYRPLGSFESIEECIIEVTKALPNVTAIRGFDLVPHDIKYYSDLFLHPNDEGFDFYFKNLYECICKHAV